MVTSKNDLEIFQAYKNSFGHHMTTLCEWNDGVTIVKNNFCDGQINCLIHE